MLNKISNILHEALIESAICDRIWPQLDERGTSGIGVERHIFDAAVWADMQALCDVRSQWRFIPGVYVCASPAWYSSWIADLAKAGKPAPLPPPMTLRKLLLQDMWVRNG